MDAFRKHDWRTVWLVVLICGGTTALLYGLQGFIWDEREAYGWPWHLLSVVWALPFITGGLSVFGMLFQRKPEQGPVGEPLTNIVSFRYVSRGTNVQSLRSSVSSCHRVMAKHPYFPYVVEVIVENPVGGFAEGTIELVVPKDYECPNGGLYKARGLQWGMEHSTIPDDAWILHCDEESHISGSLAKGIYHAIMEEERSGAHRIGQGAILYHHSLRDHPVLTGADMIRTGDDLGRFHLQNRILGMPIWGFHGSFILVRNSVEKKVGFDFGPEGSITEDAFWALALMGMGYRSRWVDGWLIEQAPETVKDFMKQRRRWYIGLLKVVQYAPAPLWLKMPLALFTVIWSVAWIGILYTYVNFVVGWDTPDLVQAYANVAFACFATVYVIGMRTNLLSAEIHGWDRVKYHSIQLVCIPFYAIIECMSVLYALVRPDAGFHVIQKGQTSTTQATATTPVPLKEAASEGRPAETTQLSRTARERRARAGDRRIGADRRQWSGKGIYTGVDRRSRSRDRRDGISDRRQSASYEAPAAVAAGSEG